MIFDALGSLPLGAIPYNNISGSLISTIDNVTVTSSGKVLVQGASNTNIDSVSSNESGAVLINGNLNITIDSIASSLLGIVNISGSLISTLDSVSSIISSQSVNYGILNSQLSDTYLNCSGNVFISGSQSQNINDVGCSISGEVLINGNVISNLEDVSSIINSPLIDYGVVNSYLNSVSSSIDGTVLINGSLNKTIDDVGCYSIGNNGTHIQPIIFINDIPQVLYNLTSYLIDNEEELWKLIYYDSANAWRLPNLTRSQKNSMIYDGIKTMAQSRVFLVLGQDDSVLYEKTILRMGISEIIPRGYYTGICTIRFEILTHFKLSTLSNYSSRTDSILQRLIYSLNGAEVEGLGRIFFDERVSSRCRSVQINQIPYRGKSLTLAGNALNLVKIK